MLGEGLGWYVCCGSCVDNIKPNLEVETPRSLLETIVTFWEFHCQ